MTAPKKRLIRAIALAITLLAIERGGAHALVALDFPAALSGGAGAGLVALAAFVMVARLVLLFVAPGLVAVAIVRFVVAHRSAALR